MTWQPNILILALMLVGCTTPQLLDGQIIDICPEQRHIEVRDASALCPAAIRSSEIPFTVALKEDRQAEPLSLDEAIQIAIRNADVIRVIGGNFATTTGRTIYDVAVSNVSIDEQLAVFDPTFNLTSTMNKSDTPFATLDPGDPTRAILGGSSTDSINTTLNLQKRTLNGATVGLNVNAVGSYFEPGFAPLEPQYRSFVEMTLRQPFVRGFGRDANQTPIIISRINTERSFFQFKNSVQQLVRSVIAAYWNLVAARVEVWAREQQIEQAEFAYKRAKESFDSERTNIADVAQAASALASFRANLISARSNMILAETALRNGLGLPPSNSRLIVPTSVPVLEQIDFDWNEIVAIAEQNRPDIIELKLILEADRQQLRQADNFAKPQFDGIANYRWDGLSGEMPNGAFLENDGGRFAGFNLGVNFSVPFGLRRDRAALRRSELVLLQDQRNLEQGIHQMVHQLTLNYRNIDQFFLQYEAFKEVRKAARLSYEIQAQEFRIGRREFINVLQAITDWGNSVSQEASSITQYNTELANIENETGSILETHGIRFVEERYGSIAPTLLGVQRPIRAYPKSLRVDGGDDRYNESKTDSDEAFNLESLDPTAQSRLEDELGDAKPNPAADGEMRIKSLKELMEEMDAPRRETPKKLTPDQMRPGNNPPMPTAAPPSADPPATKPKLPLLNRDGRSPTKSHRRSAKRRTLLDIFR
jgi:outer membrane protein TolC